jgi:hypothetical protein
MTPPHRKIPLERCVVPAVLFPSMPMDPEFWPWEYVDDGKRKRTRYRLTQRDALDRYGPSAKRVQGSRAMRTPLGHTSDWLKPSSRER